MHSPCPSPISPSLLDSSHLLIDCCCVLLSKIKQKGEANQTRGCSSWRLDSLGINQGKECPSVHPRGHQSITRTVGWLVEDINPNVAVFQHNRHLHLSPLTVRIGFSWLTVTSSPLSDSGIQDLTSSWLCHILEHYLYWHSIIGRKKNLREHQWKISQRPCLGLTIVIHTCFFGGKLVACLHQIIRHVLQWREFLCLQDRKDRTLWMAILWEKIQ